MKPWDVAICVVNAPVNDIEPVNDCSVAVGGCAASRMFPGIELPEPSFAVNAIS
jgi:hypothetical protein